MRPKARGAKDVQPLGLLALRRYLPYLRPYAGLVVVFGLAKIPTVAGLAFGITLAVRAAFRERRPLGAAQNPAPA